MLAYIAIAIHIYMLIHLPQHFVPVLDPSFPLYACLLTGTTVLGVYCIATRSFSHRSTRFASFGVSKGYMYTQYGCRLLLVIVMQCCLTTIVASPPNILLNLLNSSYVRRFNDREPLRSESRK